MINPHAAMIRMTHPNAGGGADDQFTRDIAARLGLSERQAAPAEVLAYATRLKKLNELVLALSQIHHLNEAYRVVAAYTREIIGAARVSVGVLRECGAWLDLYSVDGIQGTLSAGAAVPAADTMIGAVVARRAPIRVMDLRAAVCVPLMVHGRIIGTLNTALTDGARYFPGVEQLLLQIASVLASIVERDRLYREACEAKRQAVASERQAVVASNAKTMFLSQMTHELRTPMNGVLGMTTLLGHTELSPTQQDMVHIIQTSGDALLTTINDILDYTKIEAGKLELEDLPFAPADAIRDALTLLRAQAKEKGVACRTEVDPRCPPVVVQDACRTRQILANLVGNAIKFSARGTTVTVTARPYLGPDGE